MSGTAAGPDLESWYASVAAVLAKAKRKDVAELGPDAWRELIATTRDGIEVNPLYTRADELAERPAPGTFPFVRGGSRKGLPENGWHVCARIEVDGDAAEANRRLLDLLGEGVSALWLRADATDLGRVLREVYLDLAPVTLDAGDALVDAADAVFALLDARRADGDGVEDRSSVMVDLAAAPLTAGYGATPVPTVELSVATDVAARAAAREETVRTFVADGTAFAADGASDSQTLAYAVAAGLAYVRAMTDAGMSPAEALAQVSFRLPASDDQFQTIALFRAGRLMWARVAEALGVEFVA